MFLIENRARLAEKREILDVIWKDAAVTENALTREIGKLRKSLGDDPGTSRYIQTVHTRGYRFIAAVEIVTANTLPRRQTSNRIRDLLRPKLLGAPGAIILLAAAGLFLKRNVVAANKSWAGKTTASTLAVLPFHSLGAGPNDPYVGIAMADALITKLSGSPRLAVRPTSTVIHYSDAKLDSQAVGRTMKVITSWKAEFRPRAIACALPSSYSAYRARNPHVGRRHLMKRPVHCRPNPFVSIRVSALFETKYDSMNSCGAWGCHSKAFWTLAMPQVGLHSYDATI